MIAEQLISDILPSLSLDDIGQKALNWMETFKVSHLPIVDGDEYIALISDQDIYDNDLINVPIKSKKMSLISPYVVTTQHFFDIATIVSRFKITVVPILDSNRKYQGMVSLNRLAFKICDFCSGQGVCSTLVLEVGHFDYSLSQISQIVEGNGAKILNLYVVSVPDSQELDITLRINISDLSAIIQTFVRYDYNIKAFYNDNSILNNLYDDRFEEFMKYLNI